ncbi:MAG: ABC transporter ATP-binding protein [Ilumatobacteraceae bacterium]
MLDVVEISVAFGPHEVLNRYSLHVDAGETVGLLGPSGCGKSTLLRLIAGILTPDDGRIVVDGDDVTYLPTHRRRIGLVFQDEQLFPHLSVADNISFGLRMAGTGRSERRRRADELLATFGLAGLGDRSVDHLSGGEAKRVAVARALAAGPKVLLLDEPLTGLDRALHERLRSEVSSILRAAGTTAIWVTHDEDEARSVSDRIVRLGSAGLPPTSTAPGPIA